MIIKIIWSLVVLNTLALMVFIAAFFIYSQGRNVDSMEKGWTFILVCAAVIVILLAAIPLRYSHSAFSVVFAGFFAALPSVIALGIFISNNIQLFQKKETFASTYYKDKTQRAIASAIEQNDTTLLKELIKGQNLNIQGTRVWDWDGLNYLQFAIRVRSNPISFPFNDAGNTAAIRILIEHGAATTPALAEATRYLPIATLSLLLNAGANPNCPGLAKPAPLLFELIGTDKKQNDIAILLVKKGADINAKDEDKLTPVMYAAYNAGTRQEWRDAWRVVRYLLEEAHADYTYTTPDDTDLAFIIKNIREEAEVKKIDMPEDFSKVVKWLHNRRLDTAPGKEKEPSNF
jgi:hypothetical protein